MDIAIQHTNEVFILEMKSVCFNELFHGLCGRDGVQEAYY